MNHSVHRRYSHPYMMDQLLASCKNPREISLILKEDTNQSLRSRHYNNNDYINYDQYNKIK